MKTELITMPEGEKVLIHRPDHLPAHTGYLEYDAWFRPDWLRAHDLRSQIDVNASPLFMKIKIRPVKPAKKGEKS